MTIDEELHQLVRELSVDIKTEKKLIKIMQLTELVALQEYQAWLMSQNRPLHDSREYRHKRQREILIESQEEY